MTDTSIAEIRRRTPALITDEKGREHTENGKYSLRAMADYVARHPGKFHKGGDICRACKEYASKTNVERRRRELSKIADILLEMGTPAVLEWHGRKINAISRYNPQSEYHQSLMAAEIGRRSVKADGSSERLQRLIAALPRSLA